jgi:hypothetical protein
LLLTQEFLGLRTHLLKECANSRQAVLSLAWNGRELASKILKGRQGVFVRILRSRRCTESEEGQENGCCCQCPGQALIVYAVEAKLQPRS